MLYYQQQLNMLSKDSRLRLVEIACKIKLQRKVTLLERMWVHQLITEDEHAAAIYKRFTC